MFKKNFLDDYSYGSLIEEVKRVAMLVPSSKPLTTAIFDQYARVHSNTVRRRLAMGWREVLIEAGLRDRWHGTCRRRCTEQSTTDALNRVFQKLGSDRISRADYDRYCREDDPSSEAISQRFGSWRKALQRLGLSTCAKSKFSRDECIENLQCIYDRTGVMPTYASLSQPPSRIGPKAYERHWGRFSAALWEFMKKDPSSLSVQRPGTIARAYSDNDLLDELREVSKRKGNDCITQRDVEVYSNVDPRTFAARLGNGSWPEALERAGLRVSPQFQRRRDDEEYFENLMRVWEALGRQPRLHEMKTHPKSVLGGQAYAHRFRTWRKGVNAFLKWVGSYTGPCDVSSESYEVQKGAPEAAVATPSAPSEPACRGRNPSAKLRFIVLRRDNFRCVLCGKSAEDGIKLHLDHKIPYSQGGPTSLSNLQTLCDRCNLGKGILPLG